MGLIGNIFALICSIIGLVYSFRYPSDLMQKVEVYRSFVDKNVPFSLDRIFFPMLRNNPKLDLWIFRVCFIGILILSLATILRMTL